MKFSATAFTLVIASITPYAFGCGFCPTGSAPQNIEAMYNETMTCGQLHNNLKTITNPDECLVQQSLLLLDFPTQCGYCNPSASSAAGRCTLCSDGAIPTADAEKIAWSGSACSKLAYAALFFDRNTSDECFTLQSKHSQDCGCVPAGPRCSVCSDGLPVPLPDAYSKDFKLYCGQLEQYANQIPEDTKNCAYFRERGAIDCGCFTAEPMLVTTESPTSIPTIEWNPTLEPTSAPTGTEPSPGITNSPATEGPSSSQPTMGPSKTPSTRAPTGAPTYSVEGLFNLQAAGLNLPSSASGSTSTTASLTILSLGIASLYCFLVAF